MAVSPSNSLFAGSIPVPATEVKMEKYYWESETRHGEAELASDAQAIEAWKMIPKLLIIYKENSKDDLEIIWEKPAKVPV